MKGAPTISFVGGHADGQMQFLIQEYERPLFRKGEIPVIYTTRFGQDLADIYKHDGKGRAEYVRTERR